MNIDSIVWPSDPLQASRQLRQFMIAVLEDLSISFGGAPLPDPLVATKHHLAGSLADSELAAVRDQWSQRLDSLGGSRAFQDRSALEARLVVILLSVRPEELAEFGETLSWFLQLLWMLGYDAGVAARRMPVHFSFK